jgi:CBS domain containing-hemolysin-like protein
MTTTSTSVRTFTMALKTLTRTSTTTMLNHTLFTPELGHPHMKLLRHVFRASSSQGDIGLNSFADIGPLILKAFVLSLHVQELEPKKIFSIFSYTVTPFLQPVLASLVLL